MKENIYFCYSCQKPIDDLDDLYFVEEGSPRSFCSESCIEKYYQPIVRYFDNFEQRLRIELAVGKEPCQGLVTEADLVQSCMTKPDEIYRIENEIKEEYFLFIKKFSNVKNYNFYIFLLCYVFDSQPSFIIHVSATRSEKLLEQIRVGEKIKDPQSFLKGPSERIVDDEVGTAHEISNDLDRKKSTILAEMLTNRLPSDIPYEQFHLYDQFLEDTISNPDEVFEYKDEENDDILVYIKAHEKDEKSFYYIVLCMKVDQDWEEQTETLVPFLGFPTLEPETYKVYRKGELLVGTIKN